jgi:hypothetical protein
MPLKEEFYPESAMQSINSLPLRWFSSTPQDICTYIILVVSITMTLKHLSSRIDGSTEALFVEPHHLLSGSDKNRSRDPNQNTAKSIPRIVP